MIDNLVLGLTHALLLITAWRLWNSDALDDDSRDVPPGATQPGAASDAPVQSRWGRKSAGQSSSATRIKSMWSQKGWNRPRA